MQFEKVIGQKEIKVQLMQMVQHNRLSHALLFLGKEGSGALALALAFAQYMVCWKVNSEINNTPGPSLFGDPQPSIHQSGISPDSCGIFSACIKANQLIHPDIHFSYPVIPRKPGDKPISTDYISEWREYVSIHPYVTVTYSSPETVEARNLTWMLIFEFWGF